MSAYNIQIDCENAVSANNLESLESIKNSTLIVTGGTGFLGSWISEVIIYLNETQGFNIKLYLLSRNQTKMARHFSTKKFVNLIEEDVLDVFELPADINYVIHAAADPDTRCHLNDPITVIDTIVRGTETILSASMRLNGLRRILHISSGLVSGVAEINQKDISENQMNSFNCNSSSSVYAEAKRCSEAIVASYRSLYKLPLVIARPFTFLGPYQKLDKPWAINHFMRDAFNGGPIRILGNENTKRSYIYGADAAVWMLHILLRGMIGSAYNVGGDTGFTLKEIAKKVISVFPNPIKIQTELSQENFPPANSFVPDTSFARKNLELKLSTSIDTAIQKTVNWYCEGNKNI